MGVLLGSVGTSESAKNEKHIVEPLVDLGDCLKLFFRLCSALKMEDGDKRNCCYILSKS